MVAQPVGPGRAANRSVRPDHAADLLVVDDDPFNLTAIEAALEGTDARLDTATSGPDALRKLLRQDYAVILLDVQMPTMDGFETARLIRSRERTRHVPIIFVTAFGQDETDIRRGYQLGAVDYLFKPIVGEVLRAKVQVFIDLRNRTREVGLQAERLRAMEREAAERRLQEARRLWEAEALRRQMDEQRQLNEQLAEADRRKDEFLALLAHELRNPLAPIVAGLEVLRIGTPSSVPFERAREAIRRQVSHLVRLVDDLLDVSRITRGKIALQRKKVDVVEIARECVDSFQSQATEREHDLRFEGPDTPVYCDADPVRLTQVVNNLVSNAIRYTDPGGEVSVVVDKDDEEVVIRVVDNGRGIPPELTGQIFGMFFQERQEGRGLGLGLTLVKEVTQMHGGRVSVHSDGPGEGATFEVRIPSSDAPVCETIEISAPVETRRLRIALVEDDEDVLQTVRALLEQWGHEVEVAATGLEGADLVLTSRPDVALLDIGLPGLDGYGLARRIRDELGDAAPRLIAVTGFGQLADRERAKSAGFDAHLVKPAPPELLRKTLLELTKKSA